MKKLGQYISVIVLLGLIGSSGYFIYQKTLSPCDQPLEYAVGRFDTQFGISQSDFKSYIVESGSVWEKVLGRKVFIFNPNASFKINLIYDERQLATIQKQKTEFGLSAVENIFKQLDADFNAFKNSYDQKVSAYEQTLASYQSRKSAYDAEVISWNSQGGASQNKFQSMETEQQYLNSETARLNTEVSSINSMTKQLNILLLERNVKAAEYNKIAGEYNKKYNGGLEFNQAEYVNDSAGQRINVYQFGNKGDLVLALTHELGHALGMNHVENPKSIMYYITGANTEVSLTPSAEDLAELKRVCKM